MSTDASPRALASALADVDDARADYDARRRSVRYNIAGFIGGATLFALGLVLANAYAMLLVGVPAAVAGGAAFVVALSRACVLSDYGDPLSDLAKTLRQKERAYRDLLIENGMG